MSSSVSVTHVVLSLDCGGLERIVLDLVRFGLAHGQQVSVLCLERPGTLAAEVERAGAKVTCMFKPAGRCRKTGGMIRQHLRKVRPDVIHTHQVGAMYYAGPAAREEGVPLLIHTEHINQLAKYHAPRQRARIRYHWWRAGQLAARFCCVADDIAAEVMNFGLVPKRKVCVVQNGIDTARFRDRHDGEAIRASLGIPAAATVIGTVGRLDEVKRQDLLIRAFHRLRKRSPTTRLLIVGDGPMRSGLQALTEQLELTPYVSFVGYQAQPDRYLQAMDVFALTSRAEGLPLAILEAWAAGLPVVATRVGGIPNVIVDGQTGVLINSGDEAALVESVGRLIDEPALARRLGEAGRVQVEADFDTERMGGDYHRHYLELLRQQEVGVSCES